MWWRKGRKRNITCKACTLGKTFLERRGKSWGDANEYQCRKDAEVSGRERGDLGVSPSLGAQRPWQLQQLLSLLLLM